MKFKIEYLFLAIIFAVLLFTGLAPLYQNKIAHEFPHGYMAMDSFWELGRLQYFDHAEDPTHTPSYITFGLENVVERYPPLLNHAVVMLHRTSGIEIYDLLFFFSILSTILASILFYYLIKGFNRKVAFLAVGIFAFLFYKSFYIGYIWGRGPLMLGNLLLILGFWTMQRVDLKKSYLILAVIIVSMTLAHTSEYLVFFAFLVGYFISLIYFKKFKLSTLKAVGLGVVIAVLLCSYYFIIFKYGFGDSGSVQLFKVFQPYEPTPFLKDFSILLLPIALGLIYAGFLLVQRKKFSIALLASAFLLLLTFSNYFGYKRAFQMRYFWPIYLAIFFGLGIYLVMKKMKVKNDLVYVGVGLAFFLGSLFFVFQPVTSPGLINEYNWDAFTWIKKNTAEDSKVLFFYGDVYSQRTIFSQTFRNSYFVGFDDYVEKFKTGQIHQEYHIAYNKQSGDWFYKTGLFSFGFYNQSEFDFFKGHQADICQFDYFIFDKYGRINELVQYNIFIANHLLEKEWIYLAHENQGHVILKNNDPGVDCVG